LVPFQFDRVRDLIAKRAGIKKVPWDGYLKYYRPSPKLTEKKYTPAPPFFGLYAHGSPKEEALTQ
jgi:hypothetical protein